MNGRILVVGDALANIQTLSRAHELVRRAFGRYVSEEVAASILE